MHMALMVGMSNYTPLFHMGMIIYLRPIRDNGFANLSSKSVL